MLVGSTLCSGQLVSNYGEDRHQSFTISLGDVDSVPQGLTANITVHHCPLDLADDPKKAGKLWCIDYELGRYGTLSLFEVPHDVKLQFDIGGLCSNKPAQWSEVTDDSVGFSASKFFHLEDSAGCTIELVKVSLASTNPPEIDFTEQLKSIQAKRDAEAARAKRRTEEAAKAKNEQDAKDAAERQKIRIACGAIYRSTIDKKVRDLTVREEEQVRSCQALRLYPPPP
jgi:hypothetical protein